MLRSVPVVSVPTTAAALMAAYRFRLFFSRRRLRFVRTAIAACGARIEADRAVSRQADVQRQAGARHELQRGQNDCQQYARHDASPLNIITLVIIATIRTNQSCGMSLPAKSPIFPPH